MNDIVGDEFYSSPLFAYIFPQWDDENLFFLIYL